MLHQKCRMYVLVHTDETNGKSDTNTFMTFNDLVKWIESQKTPIKIDTNQEKFVNYILHGLQEYCNISSKLPIESNSSNSNIDSTCSSSNIDSTSSNVPVSNPITTSSNAHDLKSTAFPLLEEAIKGTPNPFFKPFVHPDCREFTFLESSRGVVPNTESLTKMPQETFNTYFVSTINPYNTSNTSTENDDFEADPDAKKSVDALLYPLPEKKRSSPTLLNLSNPHDILTLNDKVKCVLSSQSKRFTPLSNVTLPSNPSEDDILKFKYGSMYDKLHELRLWFLSSFCPKSDTTDKPKYISTVEHIACITIFVSNPIFCCTHPMMVGDTPIELPPDHLLSILNTYNLSEIVEFLRTTGPFYNSSSQRVSKGFNAFFNVLRYFRPDGSQNFRFSNLLTSSVSNPYSFNTWESVISKTLIDYAGSLDIKKNLNPSTYFTRDTVRLWMVPFISESLEPSPTESIQSSSLYSLWIEFFTKALQTIPKSDELISFFHQLSNTRIFSNELKANGIQTSRKSSGVYYNNITKKSNSSYNVINVSNTISGFDMNGGSFNSLCPVECI
jgi:hypothetical protein